MQLGFRDMISLNWRVKWTNLITLILKCINLKMWSWHKSPWSCPHVLNTKSLHHSSPSLCSFSYPSPLSPSPASHSSDVSPPSPPIVLFLSPPSLFQLFCNLYLHSLHLLPLPPSLFSSRPPLSSNSFDISPYISTSPSFFWHPSSLPQPSTSSFLFFKWKVERGTKYVKVLHPYFH